MIKDRIKQWLPDPVLAPYRSLRAASLSVYEDTVDRLANRVTGKQWLPPIHIRREVGDLSVFESAGAQQLLYLELLCQLNPHVRFLDIGCGCGRIAIPLTNYLTPPGSYVGMDIYRPAIDWARTHITPQHPHFTFLWADLHSARYNPAGAQTAANYTFPFPDDSFDFIHLRSVFTHMTPDDTAHYLQEIARLLAPGGRCVATFYLFERAQLHADADQAGVRSHWPYGDERFRYAHPEITEAICAYAFDYLQDLIAQSGLHVQRGPDRVAGQLALVLQRE